jgi:NAD(P)-dependent dehydrogenase (short-subunit alcohol dehydrogenase family)
MGVIVVTGASSGIGAAAAVELSRQGRAVVATGRSGAALAAVHRRMVAAAPAPAAVPEPIVCDLSSLAAVRDLGRRLLAACPRLDALVNNAAVQPSERRLTADGHELALAVNHLAPVLLTGLLAERLAASGGRVVTTSSSAHREGVVDLSDMTMERSWTWEGAYARSKLANLLFTAELRVRTGLPASAFHPGLVDTAIDREVLAAGLSEPFDAARMLSPEQGAGTLVWLATSPEGARPSALYYADRAPVPVAAAARGADLAARLWDWSEHAVSGFLTGKLAFYDSRAISSTIQSVARRRV